LNQSEILFTGEGLNSSVAVTRRNNDNALNFHVSGKIEASTIPEDMRLQRMLGHLPALMHPNPRSVLVVGCGAGVTAGSFTVYPGITNITICEMEPLVPRLADKYFGDQNYHVVTDARTHIHFDDARHFILTSPDKFDIITSDPIHPWVKGSATLYTREYFELVRRHLNPGGIVTQWVPLYESDTGTVKSEIATFLAAFPNGTIWSNDQNGAGYDLVLLGQVEPAKINLDDLDDRLSRPDYTAVVASLSDVGFLTGLNLFGTYAGCAEDLAPWLKDAEINHDQNLRLQYLAGLGSTLYRNAPIYAEIAAHRKFPAALFAGSSANRLMELRLLLPDPAVSAAKTDGQK